MGDPHDVTLTGDARAIYGASRLGDAVDWETLFADTSDMLAENHYANQRERLWMLFIHACALWQLNKNAAELFERLTQIALTSQDDQGHELHVAVLAWLVFACRKLSNASLLADMHETNLRVTACEHDTCTQYLELAEVRRQPLQAVSS